MTGEKVRRVGTSIVIVSLLLLGATALIPDDSVSRETVDRLAGPVHGVTGLHQDWGVFSPDPSRVESNSHAMVYFADGTSQRWDRPAINALDSSRLERWRKWETRIRLEDNAGYWPSTARFVVDQFRGEPRAVARVRLVRTWSHVPPPTHPTNERHVLSFDFFEWDPITETGKALQAVDQLTTNPRS